MQHRFPSAARVCAGFVMLAFLSACAGGGGGSSSTTPVVNVATATPAPGTLVVPGQQSSGGGAGGFVNDGNNPSSYAVTSNPSGIAFTVGGASYTTPATVTPASSGSPLAIVFSPSGYTVPIVQVYDGPHTVYYNAASAAKGTVAVSSLQSIRRSSSVSMRSMLSTVKHRGLASRTASAFDIDPTRLAVRLSAAALRTSGRSPADVERAVGSVGRETLSASGDRLRVVSVPHGIDAAAFTRQLQAQPEVAEVTPVHRRRLLSRKPTTVADPDFGFQWYTLATGTNYAWSYNTGTNARLAIIDTGIDGNNTDLTDQLIFQESAVTPIDNTSSSSTCDPLANATPQVTTTLAAVQDDNGHGTNVAGIAIAKADSVGFAGAAWGAKLMAFKIFPAQNAYCNNANGNIGATTPDEAQAVADAVANGADVISMSIGSPSFDTIEFNAIESAIAAGVTVVAAAGNSDNGEVAGTLDYPAAYPGVISVGATGLKDQYYGQQQSSDGTYATSTEEVTSYSQYSPSLSVVAPGGDAACNDSSCNDNDVLHWIVNYYTSTAYPTSDSSVQCATQSPATSCAYAFEGTSQATPQVSATAAMLIAEAGGHGRLTPAQVKYAIESTADNINSSHQGHGRLNAYRALASLIRDTAAYSGPSAQKAGTAQLVAFAYATGNTNRPKFLDASFPAGVPVNADGTFEIGDVPASTGAYRVAVWYDANGDGAVDAGDQIGVAAATCSSTSACSIGTITLHAVSAGFYLP